MTCNPRTMTARALDVAARIVFVAAIRVSRPESTLDILGTFEDIVDEDRDRFIRLCEV